MNKKEITVGCIRWDGNAGFLSGQVGSEEERVLSPEKWHSRLPFYAEIKENSSVQIRENSQHIMDLQIQMAHGAGIDYWIFCHYNNNHYLSDALKYFKSSKKKNGLKMSYVYQNDIAIESLKDIVDTMKEDYYMKVCDDNPIMFLYGGIVKESIAKIREIMKEEGLNDLFLVVMNYGAEATAQMCNELEGNALSQYTSLSHELNEEYSIFSERESKTWNDMAKLNMQVVPWVCIAWDPRPRMECDPAYRFAPPGCYDGTTSWSTASEYAVQLKKAVSFIQSHPESCKAATLITYSWNEFSEGGTLCPKINNNKDHLIALGSVFSKDENNNSL